MKTSVRPRWRSSAPLKIRCHSARWANQCVSYTHTAKELPRPSIGLGPACQTGDRPRNGHLPADSPPTQGDPEGLAGCSAGTNFVEVGAHQEFCRNPADPFGFQYGLELLISGGRSGEPMSINPFDDDNRSNAACGRPSPMFQRAGGWSTAKRTAPRVWTTSSRIGPTYGRRVCARGWQRAGLLRCKRVRVGWSDGT